MTKVVSHLNGRNRPTISFIGFGEAAAAIVSGWDGRSGAVIKAYDSKTETGGSERAIMIERYALAGVEGCETIESALAGADAVFSLVTADQAQAAATSAAESLEEGALFLDCNSCAPQTKVRSAQSVAQSGGRYVDVAIMAPVRPLLHKTPMLASGPYAGAAKGFMDQLAMSVEDVEGEVGAASSIKLVRSIMTKGMEALMVECLLVGRKLGVDDVVLDSLEKTYPGFAWQERAGYMLERVMTHGIRRAAELRETAKMVEVAGLTPRMSSATAQWQQSVGEVALPYDQPAKNSADRDRRVDELLVALSRKR